MGSYDLSPEQLTAILNDEAQKKRMRETAAGYRAAFSVGADADAAPVSDLARDYHRAIEFMPDPDTLAKDAQLAKDSGSPLVLIQEDPEVRADAVRRQMFNKGKVPRHERMRQIEESLPATNRFLKRPGNLPFITDDPESLMHGEGMLSAAVRGYLEGDLQQELGRLRASQLLGSGGKDVEDKVADVKSRLKEYGFERPERLGGRMFYGAGKLLAQRRDQIARGAAYASLAAGAVGLAAATGGLSVPGTLMTAAGAYSGAAGLAANAARVGFVTGSAYEGFIQEAGLGYDELLEIRGENGEALDPAVARAGGLIIGAVNAGIEFAQLDMWLKSVPGVRRLISAGVMKRAAALPQVQGYLMAAGKAGMSYLKLLGAESAQEVVQQGTNIVVRNAAKALSDGSFKPDSASDVIAELVETFGSSAIEFSLGMIPGPLAGGVRDIHHIAAVREYRLNRAKGLASVQAMVNDAAKEGPLARRAPEKMREFLATVNDTIKNPFGEVYIDSGVIRTLMADRGYTEEEQAVLLEDRLGVTQEEYKAAIESDSALSVRSENFALLNEQDEELGALLFPELKADPDGIAVKDVAAATEDHKASLRDELSFATRAAAASVSADDLKEWARREGLDRVYVDASAVQTLFQDAALEEKARALEALGVAPADLEQAAAEGEDVEISLDRLFDSGVPNELFDKIKDDLRAEPGAMTVRQAAAYAEKGAPGTTRQEAQAWKEKAERDVRDIEGAHRVKANIKAQLLLAGYGDDAAQAAAEVFAGKVMRSARRMGLDPETYFNVYANVKFVRGKAGEKSALSQPLNPGVDLNEKVRGVVVRPKLSFEEARRVKQNREKKEFAKKIAGIYKNDDTGWNVNLSSENVSHAVNSALGSPAGFERTVHILEGLPEIIKNAKLIETHADRHGAVQVRNIHRMYASVRLDGEYGHAYTVKLTVKEMNKKYIAAVDGIYRAYDAKVEKEEVSDANTPPNPPKEAGMNGNTPDTYEITIGEMLSGVKDNDGNVYLQPAWHGSPYKFDKFSIEHIGEGEGAQAFGWGLYFAGNKEVSEWYRKKLSKNRSPVVKLMFGNEEIAPKQAKYFNADGMDIVFRRYCAEGYSPKELVLELVADAADNELRHPPRLWPARARAKKMLTGALDAAREYADGFANKEYLNLYYKDAGAEMPASGGTFVVYEPTERERKYAREVLKWLDENQDSFSFVEEKKEEGQLFKVDIPNEADGNYLLWDTAVTEEQAERAFKALEERTDISLGNEYELSINGERVPTRGDFTELSRKFGNVGVAALSDLALTLKFHSGPFRLESAIDDYLTSTEEREASLRERAASAESQSDAELHSLRADTLREMIEWLKANRDGLSVSAKPGTFARQWERFSGRRGGRSGEAFYRWLSDMLGSYKEASLLLRDAGFVGIKYLDGSSRRKGEGRHNYVIFDDNAVNVLETYYQAQNLVKEVERVINVSKSDKETLASANLGSAGEWLVRLAEENAVKIDGSYIHSIDSYMMRHAMKEHGDAQRERSRGQIALTEEDFKLVPVIINNPDYVVFGNKNKRGQDLIVYVKNLPDGSTLYFEEVRTGRRKLAGESLRKASGASSEESLRRSLSPNARNDAGLPLKIIANPNPKGNELTQAVDDVYQQARGAVSIPHRFGEGALIQITITPKADASTAVHEMSHYFLWEMERLAQLLPHDAELQADLATTKKWLGWRDGQTDWTREQQEQWARGFEAYLREGRAPSVELASAFARFKKWLCEIYKSITELDVELSDDMRGVFDRLLASEEETEAVFMMGDATKGEGSVVDRIVAAHGDRKRRERADEVKAGVLARILKAAEERRAQAESAEAAAARARIEEEVMSMPAYRAKAAMSARMKLSAERLAADYGNDVFEGLPKDIFGSDGKFSADEVAAEFGYGSGDEMLSAVREAPTPADEVQARFEAEFGAGAPARDDARSAAEEAAYGNESVADLAAERYEIDEASRASDEEWAMIEAEDEAARAAWDDPRSRPNCVRWIRENGGLSYSSVKLVFGDEQARELLRRCGPGLFKDGALSLDVAAESMKNEGAYFGMGSANADQELFDVLMGDDPPVSPLEIAKREGFAEARAYARKRAEARRAGNAAKAAEREAERAAAFFARESAAVDKAEARAEAKAAREYIKNRAAADAEAVLAAARENVDRTPHTKLYDKVKVYKAAEEAARRLYRAAMKGRDWEAAKKGKDREMLNRALLVEAKKAIKMVENARERIINQLKRSRKHTGGMPQEWIDQIDLLFARFGIKEAPPRINAIPGLDSFCRAEDEAGRPSPVAAWLRTGAGPRLWTAFTTGQFRDFDDTLSWLVHGGREAGRLSKEFATRNLGVTATKLAAHIRSNLSKLIKANDERVRESKTFDETRRDRLHRMFSAAGASMAKIEMVTHILDAGRRGGYAWETIFRPLADAESRENAMMRRYTADFESLLNKAYTKKERKALYKKKYYKLVDKNLSKAEVLCIALNTGNKVNLERVTTGFDWSEQNLRYVIESTLDGRDWDFVQGTWDLIDTLWPQIAALQRDMVGWLPERVEAQAQTWHMKDDKGTKGRTIRGGYYPIAYNRNAKQNRFIRMVSEQQMMEDLYGGYWSLAQTKHGHTEARVKSTGFELRLDLGVVNEHICNVVHDLCYRKAVVDVNKILTYYYRDETGKLHRPVEEAVISSMGEKVYEQFRPWLRYIASGDGLPPNDFAAVFRWLRKRSQVVILGLKAAVSLSQMLGWLPAMHEVGVVPLVKNIMYFYRNPFALKERAAEVFAKSEAMRARATSRDRDLRSLVNGLHRDNKYHSFQEACFWFINLFDAGVTLPIWITAYEKALKEHGWDEAKAIAYADSAVRTTQDIGTAKDLSAIQRGGDIQKIFTMFYNAMNTQANMVMEDIWLYRAGHVSKGHLLGTFMYVVALPAIMGALLSGQGPEDEDDPEKGLLAQMFDDPAHVALWAAGETAKYPFGFVPVLRDFASMAFEGYGFRGSAALSPVEQAGKTAITYGKAFRKWRDGDEVDWRKVSMSTLLLSGYVFGLPAGQAKITIDAFLDWMEGEKEVRARDFFLYRKR